MREESPCVHAGECQQEGVVNSFNSYGEVFNYPGFYIADGSVLPGPVGTNPSLTIAALADRFAERVITRYQQKNFRDKFKFLD